MFDHHHKQEACDRLPAAISAPATAKLREVADPLRQDSRRRANEGRRELSASLCAQQQLRQEGARRRRAMAALQ